MMKVRTVLALSVVSCLSLGGCKQREPDVFSEPERGSTSEVARPGSHEVGSSPSSGSAAVPSSVPAVSRPASSEPGSDRVQTETDSANLDSDPRVNPEADMPAQWTVPEHWERYPLASQMRLDNWHLPAVSADGDQGECAVFQFAGGGDAEANIRRWLAQFKNAEGAPNEENARRAELIVDSVPTFLVRSSGTYETQMPPMTGETVRFDNYGLFGVVFATATPVFVKCTGPEAVIETEADAIAAFVRSFDFPS